MNIYRALNDVTLYIEEHLEEDIDYKILSKKIGVNENILRRLFSLLTNTPLSEYIRKRKLTNAGYDLYASNMKVIDIAMKYGYNNSTSFSRAFTSFHGIKPSQVNKNSKLKNFPRIIFNEEVKEAQDMEYEIIELDQFELYGIGKEVNCKNIKNIAPAFFDETSKKYLDLYGYPEYGMITYNNEYREECTAYYVLYKKEIENFSKFIIPKSKWLLFRIPSYNALEIQKVSDQFYLEFLPSCKFKFKDLPEFEYYHDGVTDFLIPIY